MQRARIQQIERQDRGRTGAVPAGTDVSGRGYVDAREAAEMLGVGQRAVRSLATRGRLVAKRDGEGAAARIVVSVHSVERLREERRG